MLRNVKELEGVALHARDGIVGEVKDVYFDDHRWQVRYLVVQTGAWLAKRRVLLAPTMLAPLDDRLRVFPTHLTIDQVRNSPPIDTAKPVSRQQEEALQQHYGWPAYWNATFAPGGLASPILAPTPAPNPVDRGLTDGDVPLARRGDPHLRSANDTKNHRIEAIDGAIGHVDDFLLEDRDWQLRYLLVDTRNWWPGKKVLVAPNWIKNVSWTDRSVAVDLTRDAIKGSPPYDAAAPWNPAYAAELHDHYGRPRYSDWDKDITAGAARVERER